MSGGGLEVTDVLEHADDECTGKWREEKVGRVKVYRCPRCAAVARQTPETRRGFWQMHDAERVAEEAEKRGAIREILRAAKVADREFHVALALGRLLSSHLMRQEREWIAEEYQAMDTEAE